MVRVNLINPGNLTDQHLIAEYNEIIMLVEYVRKYPCLDGLPKEYSLGEGHMRFFKNKILYLKTRHELIKKEMEKRGFRQNCSINLRFPKAYLNNWKPNSYDIVKIKSRIIQKIELKKDFYRYYRQKRTNKFLINLVRKSN